MVISSIGVDRSCTLVNCYAVKLMYMARLYFDDIYSAIHITADCLQRRALAAGFKGRQYFHQDVGFESKEKKLFCETLNEVVSSRARGGLYGVAIGSVAGWLDVVLPWSSKFKFSKK